MIKPIKANYTGKNQWGPSKKKYLNNFWLSTVNDTANFKFKYLGELEVKCQNTLGCETLADGKMFDDKNQT